jgi:4-hydroxybutyrate CoA-transferase
MAEVPAGAHVIATGYCSTPTTLLIGLAERAESAPGIVLSAGMLLGDLGFTYAVANGSLGVRSWHASGPLRSLVTQGKAQYVPLRASGVGSYIDKGTDVALVRVSPPDSDGWCSFGPSASFAQHLVRKARIVIAEVDPTMPRPVGEETRVRYSDFDHVVDSEVSFPHLAESPRSAVTDSIADSVLALIPEGANIQLGIGATPQVVASRLALGQVSDIRVIGLAGDAMVDLLESGRLTKNQPILVAEVMGTDKIFNILQENPQIRLASSSTLHNPTWLSKLPRLISVCSALAVDLSGQVSAEMIDGKTIAGVGGSMDFMEGAGLSAGGKRIIALPATTSAGGSGGRSGHGVRCRNPHWAHGSRTGRGVGRGGGPAVPAAASRVRR